MKDIAIPLTAESIEALEPGKVRREIPFTGDEGKRIKGLRLFLTPAGGRTFYFVYKMDGRMRRVRLEDYQPYHFDLAQRPVVMRTVAGYRRDIQRGEPPRPAYRESQQEARRQAKEARVAAHRPTLNTVAKDYVKAISAPGAGRYVKTWKEVDRMLKKDILPVLGNRIAAELDRGDFRAAFKTVAKRGVAVAANTQATTATMLNWAVDEGLLPFNPIGGMKKVAGSKPDRERDLSEDEIKTFWHGLDGLYTPEHWVQDGHDSATPRRAVSREIAIALKILLLTGCRRSEVALAPWKEINRKQRLWEIPSHRTKTQTAFVVPITDELEALLEELKKMTGTTPYWFPQKRSTTEFEYEYLKSPVHPATISKALLAARRRGVFGKHEPFTVHDLRRTFRTRIVTVGVDRDTAERLLNHRVGSAVERTYDRYSYLDEKREALARWSRYVTQLVGDGGQVVQLER